MSFKISVIIPNYNHAKFLQQRIESVLFQSYTDFEVIILDDCSTDNSREIIENYRGHEKISHIVYNTENSGSPFKQWNKGINLAAGEYIWLAESDDYCDFNFLTTAVNFLTQDHSDLFYSMSLRVDEFNKTIDQLETWYDDLNFSRWQNSFSNSSENELKKYLAYKCTIVNASAVVFKNHAFIRQILTGSEGFKYVGDWLFWLKYLEKTTKISYSTMTKNYFRSHAQTTRSHALYKRNFELLEIYKWCCVNLFNKPDDDFLLAYFFKHHISPYPRRNLFKNIGLIIKSFMYTRLLGLKLANYYFTGIK